MPCFREGRVFRLVDKAFFDSNMFKDHHPPEMTRAPLDKVILDVKLIDYGSPKELLGLAMDPPDLYNIKK